jgi:predicted transcriptional regulator
MIPNSNKHNPDVTYLRELIDQIGLSQRKIALTLGLSERIFRAYLAGRDSKTALDCPYVVQFALECLAAAHKRKTKS